MCGYTEGIMRLSYIYNIYIYLYIRYINVEQCNAVPFSHNTPHIRVYRLASSDFVFMTSCGTIAALVSSLGFGFQQDSVLLHHTRFRRCGVVV